jgi:thiamine biosynthesis lipoprotein
MGMPVTLELIDSSASEALFDTVFNYFEHVDEKFSTYKEHSEISQLNNHVLELEHASEEMKTVFELAEQTRLATGGFFDIQHKGYFDPSGLVKGWAIRNAAEILCKAGLENFYVEAGGDIQVFGKNSQGQNWRVGISNPFNINEIVKVLSLTDYAIATSGTYIRGQHIYNPRNDNQPLTDIMSLTVIGPDIFDADRFATAAFAMGREGIQFIERLQGFEGYMIDQDKRATFTTGFERHVLHD